jgi:glycosyltransferase involved in cell wall biosynthesis
VTSIHQFVPTLAPRDAVGTHYLAVQDTLREAGFDSEIFALEAKEEYKRKARPFRSFRGGLARDTWLLFHSSVGSPVGDYIAARPEPLLVDYHNITPAEYFMPFEPHVASVLSLGRRQLAKLGHRAQLGLADSAFNACELEHFGFSKTAVVPILLDVATLDVAPDAALRDRLRRTKDTGGADLLFVGRIAPNKAQHDLVAMLAALRKFHDPKARLHLVGGSSSNGYLTALRAYIDELQLGEAVTITGATSAAALAAYWQVADVLVVASEHEGFCVPLLEAMHHSVPIVAYGAAAVPETLADAGLVLRDKRAAIFAQAVARVLGDDALRDHLVAAGHRRLHDFDVSVSRRKLVDAVTKVVTP